MTRRSMPIQFGQSLIAAAAFIGLTSAQGAAQTGASGAPLKIAVEQVDDLKSVFATVRSKDRLEARVRTPGTVVTLKVDEGDQVKAGQVVAMIADPKLALKIKALDAQLVGLESRLATAKLDFERAEQLRERGVTPQSRVDALKTAYEVVTNELKAARAERLVAEEQIAEGQVLAPAEGRVLKVPVTEGSVVMAGESVATIAANRYLLRLELPERHARFMKIGDTIQIGARGLDAGTQSVNTGRIVQVYPELQGGRVIADADVSTLGDYFVGERAVVWISAGKRSTIVIPKDYTFTRFGLDYVRVESKGASPLDVVVQLGLAVPGTGKPEMVEVLAGLKSGDTLLRPEVSQ